LIPGNQGKVGTQELARGIIIKPEKFDDTCRVFSVRKGEY
jgi:hypothetical protein